VEKSTLINNYLEQTATQEKVEKALEVVKGRRAALVKQICDAHGKGPHDIGGKVCNIVSKGDTFYFLPVKTNADGTPAKAGPSKEELDKLVAAVTTPMAASDVAKALGTSTGPKLSELIKAALEQGLIEKTGERAQTRYLPKSS